MWWHSVFKAMMLVRHTIIGRHMPYICSIHALSMLYLCYIHALPCLIYALNTPISFTQVQKNTKKHLRNRLIISVLKNNPIIFNKNRINTWHVCIRHRTFVSPKRQSPQGSEADGDTLKSEPMSRTSQTLTATRLEPKAGATSRPLDGASRHTTKQ